MDGLTEKLFVLGVFAVWLAPPVLCGWSKSKRVAWLFAIALIVLALVVLYGFRY